MKSFTTRRFRAAYASLLTPVQQHARRAYQLFQEGPSHPGLSFKKVDEQNNIYSARVGLGYRALGYLEGSDVVWFWVGPHSEYDKRI